MLHEQTKKHIRGLSDGELVEYVLTGTRMYEAEAIAFAQAELERRKLPEEQLGALRSQMIHQLAGYGARKHDDFPDRKRVEAILCEGCGCEVPTRYVVYRQNIGALLLHITSHYRGQVCKRCNRRAFWKTTGITFLVGWWGHISFFIAPVYLLCNGIWFLRTISLRRVPDARPPHVDEQVVAQIGPFMGTIAERVATGADIAEISRDVAPQANVTPGQVYCVVRTMIAREAAAKETGLPIHAFPIDMHSAEAQ